MGDAACGQQFLSKATDCAIAARQLGAQDLERDGDVELAVDRLEHLAHGADPEQAGDLIAAGDYLADGC